MQNGKYSQLIVKDRNTNFRIIKYYLRFNFNLQFNTALTGSDCSPKALTFYVSCTLPAAVVVIMYNYNSIITKCL